MKLLLDTHVLIWWLEEPERLTAPAYQAIADVAHTVYVSAASLWELSIKLSLGKLVLSGIDSAELVSYVAQCQFSPLEITWKHAQIAGQLPQIHADPFDRMLIAQAQLEGLTLVTRDRRLFDYGVPILLA